MERVEAPQNRAKLFRATHTFAHTHTHVHVKYCRIIIRIKGNAQMNERVCVCVCGVGAPNFLEYPKICKYIILFILSRLHGRGPRPSHHWACVMRSSRPQSASTKHNRDRFEHGFINTHVPQRDLTNLRGRSRGTKLPPARYRQKPFFSIF